MNKNCQFLSLLHAPVLSVLRRVIEDRPLSSCLEKRGGSRTGVTCCHDKAQWFLCQGRIGFKTRRTSWHLSESGRWERGLQSLECELRGGQISPIGFSAALSGPRTIRTSHETMAQGIFTAGKGEWANGSLYFPPGTRQLRYGDTSFFEPVTALALCSELSPQYHSPKLATLDPGSHLWSHGISNRSLGGVGHLQLRLQQPSPSLSPYLKPIDTGLDTEFWREALAVSCLAWKNPQQTSVERNVSRHCSPDS